MAEVRLMTYEPGHFHAALVQKEMVAGVAPRVHVYASLAPDPPADPEPDPAAVPGSTPTGTNPSGITP